MSIEVTFAEPKDKTPAKGTAGMQTQMGGAATTVSALMEASEAIGNEGFVKPGP